MAGEHMCLFLATSFALEQEECVYIYISFWMLLVQNFSSISRSKLRCTIPLGHFAESIDDRNHRIRICSASTGRHVPSLGCKDCRSSSTSWSLRGRERSAVHTVRIVRIAFHAFPTKSDGMPGDLRKRSQLRVGKEMYHECGEERLCSYSSDVLCF